MGRVLPQIHHLDLRGVDLDRQTIHVRMDTSFLRTCLW